MVLEWSVKVKWELNLMESTTCHMTHTPLDSLTTPTPKLFASFQGNYTPTHKRYPPPWEEADTGI
jgi:hypothetical protein